MDRGERASRLERWLRMYSVKGTLQISVADPKPQRGTGLTSAVLGPTTHFTVTTQSPDDDRKDIWAVERSMGDFTALRTALVQRFPGAVLGHLPESRMLDLTKSKEEKNTKQGEILTHFLRILARHPFISQDQVFLTFLSVGSKFTDALKAVAPAAASSGRAKLTRMLSSASRSKRKSLEAGVTVALSDEPVTAPDWWREAIDLAAEPDDPLRLTKDVLAELDLIKKRVTDLKVTIRDFKEKMKEVGTNCLDMSKSFRAWLAVEYTPDSVAVAAEVDANGDAAPPHAEIANGSEGGSEMRLVSMSMPVLLAENANRFQNQGLIHQRMALDATATLLSAVREEILVLDAMKEEVTAARDAVIRVEEAKTTLHKREKELQMAEEMARQERAALALQGAGDPDLDDSNDPNFEKRTRVPRKAREEATSNLETAIAVASTLTRSTLNLELNFFREERIIRSDKFFAEFAQVHSDYCSKSLQVWSMQPVHGLPNPPVAPSALTSGLTVKDRVPRLQTAQSAMLKSGVYGSSHTEEESDAGGSFSQNNNNEEDQLVEWTEDIPWDRSKARPIEVAFDFEAEHDDEIEAHQGDRGTGVPFDDDRQWLHIKLEDGRSGIIPTNFVRIVVAAPKGGKPEQQSRRTSLQKGSSFSSAATDAATDLRIAELEAELARAREEKESYRKELDEREEFMEMRASELRDANQTIEKLKQASSSLRSELQRVTEERDQAIKKAASMTVMPSTASSSSTVAPTKQQTQQPRASVSPKVELAQGGDDDLPPNWVKVLDKTRNKYFYHNTQTKESVWKRPVAGSAPQQGQKRRHGEQ